MARPVGSSSHWWKTRKRFTSWLYNPTNESVALLRSTVAQINAQAKARDNGDI